MLVVTQTSGIKILKKVGNNLRTVGILTLGCKVNTYESEYLVHVLKEAGYVILDFNDICDVIYFERTPSISTTEIIERIKL